MLGIGQPELLVILFIVLLFFGPSSLPKLSKTIEESTEALKDGFTGGKNDKSLKDIAKEVSGSAREIKKDLMGVSQAPQTPQAPPHEEAPGYGDDGYGQTKSV
jgi:Sec-independent protein translocase protein TatA